MSFSICSTQPQYLWIKGSRARASVTAAQELSSCGLVALRHVESSQTKDQTSVPCIDKWILNHWTTKKVQDPYISNLLMLKDLLNTVLTSQ